MKKSICYFQSICWWSVVVYDNAESVWTLFNLHLNIHVKIIKQWNRAGQNDPHLFSIGVKFDIVVWSVFLPSVYLCHDAWGIASMTMREQITLESGSNILWLFDILWELAYYNGIVSCSVYAMNMYLSNNADLAFKTKCIRPFTTYNGVIIEIHHLIIITVYGKYSIILVNAYKFTYL